MGKWTNSLRDVPHEISPESDVATLTALSVAVGMFWIERDNAVALSRVKLAAARVRYWRHTLPVQGERVEAGEWTDATSSRRLLWWALDRISLADDATDDKLRSYYLRSAECYLRIVGKRLMAEVEA